MFGINEVSVNVSSNLRHVRQLLRKEELTTEAPSTVKPVYKITGVVSNVLPRTVVGAKVNDATTATDGTFML